MKLALPRPLALGVVAALAASGAAFAQPGPLQQASPAASGSTANQAVTGSEADNTRLNRRDRNSATTTPTDQPNDRATVKLVAQVRKAISHDKGLSMKARNVKIMVDNGVVTLRGPVASAAEKTQVEKDAAGVRGVTRVDNQLDIDTD